MSSESAVAGIRSRLRNATLGLYARLPVAELRQPVFIVGCGRSGTTILGTALSRHREITYLNEPRHLWFQAYPQTDIWTRDAARRGGRLVLGAGDASEARSARLRRLFAREARRQGRPVLVEKLPINNFRLAFLQRIFPDARFIHLYRNGLEVARSIEQLCLRGEWFGLNSYKWDALVAHAATHQDLAGLPALCVSAFDRGLLEWRLSNQAAVTFLQQLPDQDFIELSYDQFIDDPLHSVGRILEFLDLPEDPGLSDFVRAKVARRSSRLQTAVEEDRWRRIGGRLLALSMDGGEGLTRRWAGRS